MLDFALTALASILFVVDPLGAVPTYLVMTEGDDSARRRATALKASLAATLALGVFGAFGKALFRVFGLTMPAFQIAGGLILFLVALDMIRAQRPTREGPPEVSEGKVKEDIAITPLGIPMLAGPASLSTVAVLVSEAKDWSQALFVYGAIAVTGLVSYLSLRMAEPLHKWLGSTGIRVFSRVLGLLLAAIAVQFVLNGVRGAGLLQPKA